MLYSNNGCRNESNDVDKLLRYWGVSNDPCIFTNIVGAGIDTEEKRNMLLCTITAPFEKHRQNWETFFPDKPMEFVIPGVIPNKDQRSNRYSFTVPSIRIPVKSCIFYLIIQTCRVLNVPSKSY